MSLLQSGKSYLLVAWLSLGCSSSPSAADYSGVAYPNHRPTFELAGRRLGYVANRKSDSVSVLDLDAMTLLGNVQVGRDPVDIDGPRHVVIDPVAGLAYLALSYPYSQPGPHELSAGATQRSGYVEALNLLDLSEAGELRVDPNATEIAFSPASGGLAVAHFDINLALQADAASRRANLVLVEPAAAITTDSAAPRRVPVCAAPAAIAFDAEGGRVFVACTGEDSLTVVDSRTGVVLSRVPAGSAVVNKPYALVADPARARLLVSNQVAFAVSIFDMNDAPNLLTTLNVPGLPMFPAWVSDTTVVVPFQGPSGAALFDARTGEQLVQVEYSDADCMNPAEFSQSSDLRLRLVCEGDHYGPGAVVEIDPESLAIKSTVSVEIYPERMGMVEP